MTTSTKVFTERTGPKIVARLACTWCGAPSGRKGVTLKKVTQAVPGGYRELLLCTLCMPEYGQFGRKVSYKEWRAFFWHFWRQNLKQTWGTLRQLVSIRNYLRESRIQHRFRAKDEKVRE